MKNYLPNLCLKIFSSFFKAIVSKRFKSILCFSLFAFATIPSFASVFYLYNVNVGGVAPAGQNLQTNNTGNTGWLPTTVISPTTEYWYSNTLTCNYSAGTYNFTIYTNQPSGTSRVTGEIDIVNAAGGLVSVVGTQTIDVSSDGFGNHNTTFNFPGVAAQNLVNQRWRVSVTLTNGDTPATMAYNAGQDFPSNLTTSYSSCDPTLTPTPTLPPAPAVVKSVNETSGFLNNNLTYTIQVQNPPLSPVSCFDNFEADAPNSFPNGWTGPIGGGQCGIPIQVTNVGGGHNNVFQMTATTNNFQACFATYNCPGPVVDGQVCSDINVTSGRAELLWRQNAANTYQVSLGPNQQDPPGTPADVEIRVVTNGAYVVLASGNMGYANNTWYNVCMIVNGFNITMQVNGATVLTATDPNKTYSAGSVGVQSSLAGSSMFDNVTVSTIGTTYLNSFVSDTLPAGLNYVSCSGGAGCANQGGQVLWNMGPVTAGTSQVVTVVAQVNSCPGTLVNQASWDIGLPMTQVNSNAVTTTISCSTNTPTNTPTRTPTNSPTNTPTPTPTRTPTSTATNTVTNTATSTATSSPTNTFTATPSNSPTNTATPTPTRTPTSTATNTATSTATSSPTSTPTATSTPTSTNSPTPTPTKTATPTPSNSPTDTSTNSPTPTWTPVYTFTPTNSPTATATVTPTSTPTLTRTPTPSSTPTSTNTSTATDTPLNTFTPTHTPTNTGTSTFTSTPTNSFTPTSTATATATFTLTHTPTPSFTASPTSTATNSPTSTYSFTPTKSPTASPTSTFTFTATPTSTPTASIGFQKQVSKSTAGSGDSLTYTLSLSVLSNTATNIQVTDQLPPGLTFAGFGSTAGATTSQAGQSIAWSWAFLAPGDYSLTYNATVNSLVPGGTVLTNRAQAVIAGGTPQSASVNVTVLGQYTVKIGVYNEAGELVKTILTTQFSQPINNLQLQASNQITGLNDPVSLFYAGQCIGSWDGSTQSGDPATNGVYYVKVDNIDSVGVDTSITQQVVVSRSLYKVSVDIYNEAGEVVRHLFSYVDNPGQSVVSGIQVLGTTIQPSYGTPVPGARSQITIVLSQGVTLYWDGRNDDGTIVTNGQYYVEAVGNDGQGKNSQVVQEVSVESRGRDTGLGTIYAEPNQLISGLSQTYFRATSSSNLTLEASIYTVAGEKVVQVQGDPGTNQVGWNAQGVASGLYLAVVTAMDTNGHLEGRQILKVLFIR